VELVIAEVLDLVSMPYATPDTPAEPVKDDTPETTTHTDHHHAAHDLPDPMPHDNAMHDAVSDIPPKPKPVMDETPEPEPEMDPHTGHEPKAPTPAPSAAEAPVEPVVPADLVAETPVELDIAEVLDLVSMPYATPDTPAEPVKDDTPETTPSDPTPQTLPAEPETVVPTSPIVDALTPVEPVVEPRDIALADDTANEDEEQPMFKSLFSFIADIFGAIFGGGGKGDTPALKIPPAPKDAVLLSDLLPVTGSMEDDEPALEDMDVEDEGKELFA
jgi:hypothetical protein